MPHNSASNVRRGSAFPSLPEGQCAKFLLAVLRCGRTRRTDATDGRKDVGCARLMRRLGLIRKHKSRRGRSRDDGETDQGREREKDCRESRGRSTERRKRFQVTLVTTYYSEEERTLPKGSATLVSASGLVRRIHATFSPEFGLRSI